MKKITAILISLILVIFLAIPVSAAAARAFLLQEYDVVSKEVFCYGKCLPAGGQLEVSEGARIIENAAWSTLKDDKIPVTIYCLVDSSTSLPDRQTQQREDMLLTFSSMMGEEDSMVLATIDAALTESQPMNTKDARDTAIQTISGQTWYTHLHDGISQALKSLHTSTSYNTNRCLVIISDGHDDGSSSATSEAILKQIQEAGIPVYNVILNTGNCSEKELAQHKQFAEESLGGFLSFPDKDGISASAAAQNIWNNIKGASVIRIGTEELQNGGADQQILIRYTAADTRYEDTILIRAVDLPAIPTEPPVEATEETESTTETTSDSDETDDEEELPMELILGCGIGIVLLGAGIAAFFLTRKKKAVDSNLNFDLPSEEEPVYHTSFETDPIFNSGSTTDFQSDAFSSVTAPVEDRCRVSAVAIMHPEIAVDFYLTQNLETTFGRNEKADIVLNANDKKLSGCHGCFFWDGKMLLVQDRDSTNGTAVNGEMCPKHVWLRLENGAVLTAGKYEYRITFEANTH